MKKTFSIQQTTTETIEVEVKPCIKCGQSNITTYDCGYSSFNVCGVECQSKGCGRKISRSGDWSEMSLVKLWNSLNGKQTDADRVRILRKQIERLNKEPEA